MPHGDADNKEKEYQLAPRLLLSLHDQDGKDYVQGGAQDKTNEGYNFVKWHNGVVSRVSICGFKCVT